MTEFTTTSQAFEVARVRASIAQHEETRLLHMAVYDACEAGMSVREASTALRVPKSTVARHWREGHRCADVPPMWGTPEEYMEAERAIWAHAPERIARQVPYVWTEGEDRSRIVRAVAAGPALAVQIKDERE